MACPALGQGSGFVTGMLRFVDCQAQAIGGDGYAALTAPGATLSLVLTGLLTLFVALFGYRMLVGHTPSVRDGVLALVKIGVVLAMAGSWPAYRTLVYDVALRGPAELAAGIGAPAHLPGAAGGMVARLDFTDRALTALAIAGVGPPPAADQNPVPPPFAGFDAFALGGARILYLFGVIGAFAAVRIVAGLLLALGPFFFAFLLFDATRGLFEGWLRALAGSALGALGISIVLGVELALLEPWLMRLLDLRAAGVGIPGAPVELLVATAIFCAVLAAMLVAMARVAFGFRLPTAWQTSASHLVSTLRHDRPAPHLLPHRAGIPAEDRSRAAAVVDAVAASQRRERDAAVTAAAIVAPPRTAAQAPLREVAVPVAAPLGQSFRRTGTRVSASAGRRDRGA